MNNFIDESFIGPHGIPIEPSEELRNMFSRKPDGLVVEEISMEDFLAARFVHRTQESLYGEG